HHLRRDQAPAGVHRRARARPRRFGTAGGMSAPRPCLVCGADAWTPHLGDLRRCTACGFVTADLSAPIDAGALYSEAYFRGEEYLDYAADEAFIKRTLQPRLDAVRRRVPGGRLLEIGSAYGFFLDLARAHFDVVGFE